MPMTRQVTVGMESFVRKQNELYRSIASFVGQIQKGIDDQRIHLTNVLLDRYIEEFTSRWKKFCDEHEKLLAEEELRNVDYLDSDLFSRAELEYFSGLSVLESLRHATTAAELPPQDVKQEQSSRESLPPLPHIKIPEFSGSYLEWESFRDAFEGIVLARSDVPDVQKLLLLKGSLKGDAALLVRNLPCTSANLSNAWQAICSRYTNLRLLANAHLSALFDLPAVSRNSPIEMRILLDRTREELRALQQLGCPITSWDDIIVFLSVRRLDAISKREWELHLSVAESHLKSTNSQFVPSLPTFAQLEDFLESRIRALEMSSPPPPSRIVPNRRKETVHQAFQASSNRSTSRNTHSRCAICSEHHTIYACDNFSRMSPSERLNAVRRKNRCYNCLGTHSRSSCNSSRTCSRCNGNHHTLLHDAFLSPTPKPVVATTSSTVPADQQSMTTPSTSEVVRSHLVRNATPHTTALLTTALVTIVSPDGSRLKTRALLDSGSEVSFVAEFVVQQLRLQKRRSAVRVVGIGASASSNATSRVGFLVESRISPHLQIPVQALVLPRLSNHIPARSISPLNFASPDGIELADPEYHRARKIGLVLGADVFGSLLLSGVKIIPDTRVTAINTTLGWVLSGTVNSPAPPQVSSLHASTEEALDESIRKFWELEEIPVNNTQLSPDQQVCEEHFKATYRRDLNGRFIVRLPLKRNIEHGDNRAQAIRSLEQVERRLSHDPNLRSQYCDFMHEYESLGHMETAEFRPPSPHWFLPHHAVIQSDSHGGSKLRVVFDASRANSHGKSLNEFLHSGPPLQNDITLVLLNWRNFRFVFCADIVKMFRQIMVHPLDRNLQQIVWRPSPSQPLVDYQLNTVTYGTTCAPYLAMRVLKELVRLEGDRFPEGAACLTHETYVDDILSGADTLSSAIRRRQELVDLLSCGQFRLGKWSANHSQLLESSDTHDSDSHPRAFNSIDSTKTLGLLWYPSGDEFRFRSCQPASSSTLITKRTVLSRIAQMYDPLGWISPLVIIAKIFMQDLWLAKAEWDEPLGKPFQSRWFQLQHDLVNLDAIRVPRWTHLNPENSKTSLHGFADASTRAYAACIYLRTCHEDGSVYSTLLIAKSKTAPVKTISVPRLELCAAQLLTRLFVHVRRARQFASFQSVAWSDSSVALSWIHGHPSRWKTFVANRVSYIQTNVPELVWRHVRSCDNPADVATRGATSRTLASSRLWWDGPPWLRRPPESWPATMFETLQSPGEEAPQKSSSLITQIQHPPFELLTRYSSLARTLRVTAICLRFGKRCRRIKTEAHFITSAEIADAKCRLIRLVQSHHYAEEIAALSNNKPMSRKSSLYSLHPFLNHDQLLCVGGRLENAQLSHTQKHPPVLPKSSPLAILFASHAHKSVLHGGLSLTIGYLHSHVWIPRGRSLVKQIIRTCVVCRRRNPKTECQLMGQLPSTRVNPSRPFLRSGVDYAGPIRCRTAPGRGHRTSKAYIALFVCLCTKAIHLEAVSDLTTNAFLAAFRRFVSRRGVCAELWSDNGTTFVGADAQLRSMFQEASEFHTHVAATLADSRTHWRFIPPSSPHFGGLWEAGVRSVKGLLRKTIGEQTLTFEELTTVLSQVEACLNSRPLTPLSSDPSDLSALTPAHFLVGSSLLTVPEPEPVAEPKTLRSRWQLVQQMQRQFWRQWSTQYLHCLQQRSRWRDVKCSPSLGQLVLIQSPTIPPGRWLLGRITALHPGLDGLVRVVTVRTATSEFRRPVTRLSLLPVESPEPPSSLQSPAGEGSTR